MNALNWPGEQASRDLDPGARWFNQGSNYCLDFHGDPATAELTVYSDGNHHMALAEALETFRSAMSLSGIFYCTTPPKVYLDLISQGYLDLGNLRLSNVPDLVIGPDTILGNLEEQGKLGSNVAFAQSRGNSLLVRKGNPAGIVNVKDLFAADCRLFISNPVTEKASYVVYRETLERVGRSQGVSNETLNNKFSENSSSLIYGQNIHHREAPQSIASGETDAALVYHHLALRYVRVFPEEFDMIDVSFDENNVTTVYHAGLFNQRNQLAKALEQFLHGEQCRDIYASHGLAAT